MGKAPGVRQGAPGKGLVPEVAGAAEVLINVFMM
jgi:hypothetical protein